MLPRNVYKLVALRLNFVPILIGQAVQHLKEFRGLTTFLFTGIGQFNNEVAI